MKILKERWKDIDFLQIKNSNIESLNYKNSTILDNVDFEGITIGGSSSFDSSALSVMKL